MRAIRGLAAIVFAVGALLLGSGSAFADVDWCDDGSPPPNDFRLVPTGAPSSTSSTSWTNSTTSGTLNLSTGTNTLQGGVANGMQTAVTNAGTRQPAANGNGLANDNRRDPPRGNGVTNSSAHARTVQPCCVPAKPGSTGAINGTPNGNGRPAPLPTAPTPAKK